MNDGDDDGLNDMGRERVMDENGEKEKVASCSILSGFFFGSANSRGTEEEERKIGGADLLLTCKGHAVK